MRLKIISITFLVILLTSHPTYSQILNIAATDGSNNIPESTMTTAKNHLNFFIISKRKKGKLDLATRFNTLRSKVKSFFRGKKFVAIVTKDAKQASAKIQHRLNKYNANIGTIWFDSHGKYVKGYSLFFIGHDEFNYKNLKEPAAVSELQQLTPYTDTQTKLIIGACYGGATYYRSSIDYRDTTRMNGDSLMIALGNIFDKTTIYASESWVMTKPGLFMRSAAVAGYPKQKLYRDLCYRPVWETIGKWNEYDASSGKLRLINPIALDRNGNLVIRKISYNGKEKVQHDISINLLKLEPDLYK